MGPMDVKCVTCGAEPGEPCDPTVLEDFEEEEA